MGLVDNQHRQCLRKARYESRRQALTEIRRARSNRGRLTALTNRHEPYHCPWCGFWHIGRQPPKGDLKRIRRKLKQRLTKPTSQEEDAA